MADYLFLIPALPLAAFAINFIFGRWFIKDKAFWIAVPAVFASWVLSVLTFFDVRSNHDAKMQAVYGNEHAIRQHLFTWIPSGDFHVNVNLYVDQLTAHRGVFENKLLQGIRGVRHCFYPIFFSCDLNSWPRLT